jgi:hypothetical protein
MRARQATLLPDLYQDDRLDVQPVSMGSAALKFGADGRVAWNDMWATFCDLAMAGGPPHRGTLLEPGTADEINALADQYRDVVAEICRGVAMVTGLPVEPSPIPGWVRIACLSEGMSGWLLRAVVMENVSARAHGAALDLPAGPHYRLEKEIKNVVTVIAKTSHYLIDHMTPARHRKIAALFTSMATTMPLIEPERPSDWRRIDCADVASAIRMMRALVASNVLARREGTVLCVPINSVTDPSGEIVAERFTSLPR